MIALVLPAELHLCVEWLRAVNTQSWRAGSPPPLPARPSTDGEVQAFYDYLAPVYQRTVQVWQGLATFRG
jgi:hypothetical protein